MIYDRERAAAFGLLPRMVGRSVNVSPELKIIVTHISTESIRCTRSGESIMAVNPIERPMAFASTGVAT